MSRAARITPTIISAALLAIACGKGNANGGAGGSAAGGSAAANASTAGTSASGMSRDSSRSASAGSGANGASAGRDVAASSDISQMSDSNIVAKLDDSDKGEVQLARLIETKATNDSVKAYARQLVTDHTKSEKDLMSLERQQKLVERPAKSDTTRQQNTHVLNEFRKMKKGATLDSAFVQHEIEDHQHDIADARAMANQAKDPQLKQQIQQTLPVLQQHLQIAQRLSQQRGSGTSR